MIRLPDLALAPRAMGWLGRYQDKVDRQPDFPAQVAEAKSRFKSANRANSRTFQAVKETLSRMSSGAARCHYCEDSVHDEVEHHQPKHFFPSLCFSWPNYLYSCGPCNGPKGARFGIIDAADTITEFDRSHSDAPPAGAAALLNPRTEDPLQWIALDLQDTFRFVPREPDEETLEHRRAKYTIEVLRLNQREYLPRARAAAYLDYRSALQALIHAEEASERDRLTLHIQTRQHPSVWSEMKRQHAALSDLRELFAQIPEALDW